MKRKHGEGGSDKNVLGVSRKNMQGFGEKMREERQKIKNMEALQHFPFCPLRISNKIPRAPLEKKLWLFTCITLRSKSLTWNIYTFSSGCNVLTFYVLYVYIHANSSNG